ncbi:MAG TPA: hypothetical protein VHC49_01660 [Mycobacteriales bacterium]|nr:hypothetical protein [Mycobacteriales bacterium]
MTDWEMSALANARWADLHAEVAAARARRPKPDDTAVLRCLVQTYATVRVISRR